MSKTFWVVIAFSIIVPPVLIGVEILGLIHCGWAGFLYRNAFLMWMLGYCS